MRTDVRTYLYDDLIFSFIANVSRRRFFSLLFIDLGIRVFEALNGT